MSQLKAGNDCCDNRTNTWAATANLQVQSAHSHADPSAVLSFLHHWWWHSRGSTRIKTHKMLIVCQQTHLQLFNKTSMLLTHLPNSPDLDQEYCHIETQSFNHSTKNSAMKTPSQIAATHNLIQNKMSKITAIYRWVCLYFKMIVTQVAFHAELVNRSCVVHSDLGLLSVVSDAHRNVLVAAFAPDVIRHLKPSQTNTLLKQNNIVLWPFPRWDSKRPTKKHHWQL